MPFPLPRWPPAQRQPSLLRDRQGAAPPAQAARKPRGGERREERRQRGREAQPGKRGAGTRRWPAPWPGRCPGPPARRWGPRLACHEPAAGPCRHRSGKARPLRLPGRRRSAGRRPGL